MAVSRKDLEKPSRPKTVVEIEGLGELIVQALGLSDRLAMLDRIGAIGEGESASRSAIAVEIPEVLHRAVVDPDGKSIWSVQEWQDYGSTDDGLANCMTLYAAAQGLMTVQKKASKGRGSSRSASA